MRCLSARDAANSVGGAAFASEWPGFLGSLKLRQPNLVRRGKAHSAAWIPVKPTKIAVPETIFGTSAEGGRVLLPKRQLVER